jgi:hypothetical protein
MATTPPEIDKNNSKFGAEKREKIFNFYAVRENWSKLLTPNSSSAKASNKACLENLIEEQLASGNFGKAHIYLHCLKDNAQGKYSFYSEYYEDNGKKKPLDMPIWFRDSRSDYESQSSKTDSYDFIMKCLGYINMTLTLLKAQQLNAFPALETMLTEMAHGFFKRIKNLKKVDHVNEEQALVRNCLNVLKNHLTLDETSAKNLLLKSLDLANIEIPLCAKATVTKHKEQEILDIDVPIYELSTKLKQEYECVLFGEEASKPEWFKAQNKHMQNLIAYYACFIHQGKAAIPSDCEDILPGVRNAAEDRLYLYRKDGTSDLIYRGFHTGNLGHSIMRSRRSAFRRALESGYGIGALLLFSLAMLAFAIAACIFPLIPVFSVVFIPAMIFTSLLGFYAIYYLNAKDNVAAEDLDLTVMAAEQLKEHVDSKYLFVNTLTSRSIFEPSVNYLENQVAMALSDLNPRNEKTNEITAAENFYSNTPVNSWRKVIPTTNLTHLNQLFIKLEKLHRKSENSNQRYRSSQLKKDYLKLSNESGFFDSENVNLQLAATVKEMAWLINQMVPADKSKGGHRNLLVLVDACKGGRDRGGLSRFLAKVNAIFATVGGDRDDAYDQYLETAIKMAVSGHVQSQCDLGSKRGNGAIKKVTGDWSVPDFLGDKVKEALLGKYAGSNTVSDFDEPTEGELGEEINYPEGLPELNHFLSKVECFNKGPKIKTGPGKAIAEFKENVKKYFKSEVCGDGVDDEVSRSSISRSSSKLSRYSGSHSSSSMFWRKPDANAPSSKPSTQSRSDSGVQDTSTTPPAPEVSI